MRRTFVAWSGRWRECLGILTLACMTWSAIAQGTVLFNNRVAGVFDVPLTDADATLLAGPEYVAQLYGGPSDSELKPLGAAAPFRSGAGAGYWNPGGDSIRLVSNLEPGQTATVQARIWERRGGETYEAAKAAGAQAAESKLFKVITGGAGEPPAPPAFLAGLEPFGFADFGSLPPVLEALPAVTPLLAGQTLELQARGGAGLSYQWRLNDRDLEGATGARLVREQARLSDAGNYTVVARGRNGLSASSSTQVTVREFELTDWPVDQAGRPGLPLELKVGWVAAQPVRVQWQFNGRDIPGATSATYAIGVFQPSDAGDYTAIVSGLGTTERSPMARVSVGPVPGITLLGEPQDTALITGRGGALAVVADSPLPLFYQWRREGTNLPGATNAYLVVESQPSAWNYSVVVHHDYGVTITSRVARVTVGPFVISQHPESRTTFIQGQTTFKAAIEGTLPDNRTFDWRRNGVPLAPDPNVVSRFGSLIISKLKPEDEGDYDFVARAGPNFTPGVYAVTSRVARLTLILPPPPAFIIQPVGATAYFTAAAAVSVGISSIGPYSFQWFFNRTNPLANTVNVSYLMLTNLQAGDAGDYSVVASNLGGFSTSHLARVALVPPPKPAFATQPRPAVVSPGSPVSLDAKVISPVPLGLQWYFGMGIRLKDANSTTLTLPDFRASDAGDYFLVASNYSGAVTSQVARLTLAGVTPPIVRESPRSVLALVGGEAVFEAGIDSSSPVQYQWRFNDLAMAGETNRTLKLANLQASRNGVYSVVADNAGGSVIGAVVRLTVLPLAPPNILRQPGNRTTRAGEAVTLSVDVSGAPPLSFQWRRNGEDLPGATDSRLIFPYARPFESGEYSVVVSNSVGTATSWTAKVEVAQASSNRLPADVDGDGHNDLIFQHRDGAVGFWHMDGTRLLRSSLLSHRLPADRPWRVIGMGQAKRDGHPDILLESAPPEPLLAIWNLEGTNLVRGVWIYANPSGLRAASFRDFDGDGSPDVLRQFVFAEPVSSLPGSIPRRGVYWLKLDGASPSVPENRVAAPSADPYWVVAGSGDLDGDGEVEIVTRSGSGALGVWFGRAGAYGPQTPLAPGSLEVAWQLRAIVDLDGDGKDDLVFQHEDGKLLAWFMNGWRLARAAYLEPSYPGEGWELAGPK